MELLSLVLLGCRVAGPAQLSPPAARRAQRALRAFEEGLATGILACGGKRWGGVREADALCAYLAQRGVPEAALERETWSRSTRQNAHFAARLLLPRGVRRIALVTCDFHMARALRCFRGAGFDVEPLAAASPPQQVRAELLRATREHLCWALDSVVTRGFSKV